MLANVGFGTLAVLLLLVVAPAPTSTSVLPGLPQLPAADAVGALAPADYVDGAYVAPAPTRPDRGATVLLDAGHGAGYTTAGREADDRGVVGSDATDEASNAARDLVLLGATPPGSDLPQSEMPGADVEPLFITDPAATDLLRSDEGRRVLADSIGDGVEAFLRGPDPRR